MKKIFQSNPVETKDEDGTYTESVYVFSFDNDEESEDFSILSHSEQLSLCGFKEERTPSTGTIHRYLVDNSDYFVVIRESIMTW